MVGRLVDAIESAYNEASERMVRWAAAGGEK